MTPTPPSTNSSTGGRSPEAQFRVVRKRNRVPLSCYPCRTRKKCDRSHPCSNCTKREGQDTTSCTYAAPVTRRKNQSQGESSPDDMQSRIDRLEGLVLSLMHGGANIDPAAAAGGSADPSTSRSVTDSGSSAKVDEEPARGDNDGNEESDIEDDLATSLGVLKVDSNMGKSMYVGQEHWHTILADIAEVKNYFMTYGKTELESSYERMRSSKPATAREGPTLLLGAVPASEIELRAELPPKSTVLALCSRYFNSMDNAVNIIHGPTFQQQLQAHWQDPAKTPLMWLGMVYSILCIAMLSYHKAGDEPPEWKGRAMDLASEYRLRTVQCLIKADYTKPAEYTIETMLLYVFGEYSSRWDADVGIWLIVSVINRTAYRMGYHRDPKWFPSIPPFQAEMRRRVWAMVRMADVVFSHQVSLPSMIHEYDCDTDLPGNIFDDELQPGMKALPPPRPNTEPTPIAYMIAKARLCNELGSILQATNRVGKPVHYDEVIRFDAKLRQIMHELPPHLKLTPLEGSHDPVTLIISRFNMEILYLKIMCLLHRKYMTKARQNPRYAHSRRSAIEASMQALTHLAVLHRESQQTGRLRSLAWFIKSIATKDFVLPAMLVVLDLHYDNMAMQSGQEEVQEGAETWSPEQRANMIEAVQTAGSIWQELSHTSMVALKAGKVIDIMLKKIQNPARQREGSSISSGSESIPSMVANFGLDPSPTLSQDFLSPSSMPTGVPPPSDFGQPLDVSESSAFMDFGLYTGVGSDFQMEGLTATGAQSPFSILANLGGNNASAGGLGATQEVPSTIDWNTFENYAQMANWGADQGFQVYGTGDEQNPTMN